MLFGYGKLAWTSRNGGASFTKISLPLYPRTRFTYFFFIFFFYFFFIY